MHDITVGTIIGCCCFDCATCSCGSGHGPLDGNDDDGNNPLPPERRLILEKHRKRRERRRKRFEDEARARGEVGQEDLATAGPSTA